jgi:hypothetical protein
VNDKPLIKTMTPEDLDNQLRAALGVETSPEQLARLERFWHAQSRAERRRRTLQVVAMLVAATVAWQSTRRAEQPVAPRPQELATADPAPVAPRPEPIVENEQTLAAAHTSGREPTEYERLVFAIRTRRPIDRERNQRVRTDGGTAREEDRQLIAELAYRREASALPELLRFARHPDLRADALAAVERIVGVDRLTDVAAQSRDPVVRTALYERLLTANSFVAIPNYLALVASPGTRAEALSAARTTGERLPLEPLLRELDSSDKTTRLAAAMVLGDVNGPAVSAALIARVSATDRAPVEAWVALLACRGPAVDQFLAAARRQPRMLGQVNNARALWARMVP